MYVDIIQGLNNMVWSGAFVLFHIKTDTEQFFELVFPYLEDIVVGVECVFCRHWLADLCARLHVTALVHIYYCVEYVLAL